MKNQSSGKDSLDKLSFNILKQILRENVILFSNLFDLLLNAFLQAFFYG